MAYIRKPNFEKDNEFGKIGENLVRRILSESDKTVALYDVSDDYRFRLLDIDFVQIVKTREDGGEYTVDDVFDNIMGKDSDRSFFNLYEVKTDSRSLESRNVVYEIISHDGPGCAALTRANYFFYIFVDGNKDVREGWFIDVKKWRKFIRESCDNVVGMKDTKNGGIALNNYNRWGDRVMNILTNIDFLKKEKIASKINVEKYA